MSNQQKKEEGVKTEVFTNMTEQEVAKLQSKGENMEQKESTDNTKAEGMAAKDEKTLTEIPVEFLVIEYHPRKNLGDLTALQGSIKRDGMQEPLLVYEIAENKYGVIDGCRRLAAIKEFGWKNAPCLVKKGTSARDAAHLSYVKNCERSTLDPVEVAMHLKAMMERFGFTMRDLEIKGYGSAASISNRLKLLDLPEPVQGQIREGTLTLAHGTALAKLPTDKEQIRMAKRITDHDLTAKRADTAIKRYLEKGGVEEKKPAASVPDGEIPGVYIKDSRDMSELPDKSVHLIVSSPPYGVGMEYEKGVSFDEHIEMVGDVLKECARVLVEGGIIALNVGDIHNFKGRKEKNDFHQMQLMGHLYQNALRKFHVYLTDQIIWKKSLNWKKRPDVSFNEETVHCSYRFLDNWEPIYVLRKKGERTVPAEDVVLKSKLTKEQWTAWAQGVWAIDPVRKQEGHPAVFPDELPHRLIKMFSYEGDIVLDPWLGSGTTVKVARELNRVGIGYEKEAQYKEVIMKRLGIPSKADEHKEVDKKIEIFHKAFTSAIGGDDPFPQPVQVKDEEEKEKPRVEHADDYLAAEVGKVA